MKKFRLAHSDMETTELKDVEADDFLVSVPVRTIKLAKCARNYNMITIVNTFATTGNACIQALAMGFSCLDFPNPIQT